MTTEDEAMQKVMPPNPNWITETMTPKELHEYAKLGAAAKQCFLNIEAYLSQYFMLLPEDERTYRNIAAFMTKEINIAAAAMPEWFPSKEKPE